MTQQEGENDTIADENTPFRSAAGVAVAKAAVRDVGIIIIHCRDFSIGWSAFVLSSVLLC